MSSTYNSGQNLYLIISMMGNLLYIVALHPYLLLIIIPFLYLNVKVPVTGLKTQFRGGYVRDLAENLVKLAKVVQILI